ncbi:MAG: aminotransferase class III-fold pyridoxal phosphate-dependent enzyme [Chloroflexi bacterium]|nr:aminotransferase class III-fold pyridoxal phosphate-dependent enzyme [Chloroflexota bacterium]
MAKKVPNIVTPPPGPEALKWIQRDNEKMAPYNRPFYYPLVVAGGEGAVVRDVDGNEYIDWNSGLGVLNVGQCHPRIINAMMNKAKDFMHYSYTDFRFREPVEMADRLDQLLPMKCKYFFANSGTEANEAALKIARHSTRKQLFIGFIGSFHGRTFGTMAFSSTSLAQRRRFHPLMPGVTLVPYPYCYRCPYKLEYPGCDLWCVDFIEEWVLQKFVPPDEVAGFLFESIAGEGGYIVPPPEFLPRLKRLADKYGMLLIDDEIQVGCGRTGKFLAIEHWGVVPDIVTLGKAVGGGVPLSIAAARKDVMDLPPGAHCTTTGGNPVACAAGMAFLDILLEENLMRKATELGDYTLDRLKDMQAKYQVIGDVRGKGLAICIELVKDRKTKEPVDSKDFIGRLFRKGVLAVSGGVGVRIFPPLIISREMMDSSLDILEATVEEVNREYHGEN